MSTTFIGTGNYESALLVDADYNKNLVSSIKSMLTEVPIITMFSMMIACILNQKFRGRTFARVLFFLPVIIASGVVIQILTNGGMSTDVTGKDTVYALKQVSLKDILTQAGFSTGVIKFLTDLMSSIFQVVWKSGIQIILFLAGLQTIPASYFEVSSLEGATKWEEFWKITFPLLSPMTLVTVIYTIIDSFTYIQNLAMTTIKANFDALKYGLSAAESWLYFVIIFVVIILVTKIVFKNTVYTEE
jgi:ABC-type sugar transport system permease subunit